MRKTNKIEQMLKYRKASFSKSVSNAFVAHCSLIESSDSDIKQLLDEVEHDIMNYPKPKAEADNTDTRF